MTRLHGSLELLCALLRWERARARDGACTTAIIRPARVARVGSSAQVSAGHVVREASSSNTGSFRSPPS
jgi:hypothetical protein